jgi:hypothetical protein
MKGGSAGGVFAPVALVITHKLLMSMLPQHKDNEAMISA